MVHINNKLTIPLAKKDHMLKENAITTLNRCGLNVTQYYAVKEICYTFYVQRKMSLFS